MTEALPSVTIFELNTLKPVREPLDNDALPSVKVNICDAATLKRDKPESVPVAIVAEPSVTVRELSRLKPVNELTVNVALPSVIVTLCADVTLNRERPDREPVVRTALPSVRVLELSTLSPVKDDPINEAVPSVTVCN